MLVILRGIPANTNRYEILTFLQPALKGVFFKKKGRIDHIRIVKIQDVERDTIEFHGLVRIEPDSAALRVIKMLNRKVINGKNIAVREFQARNWHNDPRIRRKAPKLGFPDRRQGDRRRKALVVLEEDGEIVFSGNKSFHRTR